MGVLKRKKKKSHLYSFTNRQGREDTRTMPWNLSQKASIRAKGLVWKSCYVNNPGFIVKRLKLAKMPE